MHFGPYLLPALKTGRQKSNELPETPSSSSESVAGCSSKADDESVETSKKADSTTNPTKHDAVSDDEEPEEQSAKKQKIEETETPIDEASSTDNSNEKVNESDDQKSDPTDATSKLSTNEENSVGDDILIDVEDPDDYLLFLEGILFKIHSRFYTHYDETKQVCYQYRKNRTCSSHHKIKNHT